MSDTVVTAPKLAAEVVAEAGRRRTFAVISHPDAGKSTLTEALALHAQVISEAGAVHGKGDRRGVTSDWMAMERDRGILAGCRQSPPAEDFSLPRRLAPYSAPG